MTADSAPLKLFFAIFPGVAARDALAGIACEVRRDTGGRSPRPERIHLTLLYLGLTPAQRRDELIAAAARIRAPALEFRLDRLECWKKNRIVYAAPQDAAAVTRLAHALARQVALAGFEGARERFVPHVTLVRDASRTPPGEFAPVVWPVDRLLLVRSVTQGNRSRYEALAQFPLVV